MACEILKQPLEAPSTADLSEEIYTKGPYHFYVKPQTGMPTSVRRRREIISNFGSDKAELPKSIEAELWNEVESRSSQMVNDKYVVPSDTVVNFFKDLARPIKLSFLQPGSKIMSMCKVKAEFWWLHLDGDEQSAFAKTMKKLAKTMPKHHPDDKTVGITVPFRFKPVRALSKLGVDFENTVGLMNVEMKKMKWKKGKENQAVVEISVFSTDKSLSEIEGSDESIGVQFLTDFGQFVKTNTRNIKNMSIEDVGKFMEKFGFRSHRRLKLSGLNGRGLLKMAGPEKDPAQVAAFFSLCESECERLINTVKMFCRRAAPAQDKADDLGKSRNTAEIEILPFVKPVHIRFDRPLGLEAEIRSTATAVLHKLLKKETKSNQIKQILGTQGVNQKMWQSISEEDDDQFFQANRGTPAGTKKKSAAPEKQFSKIDAGTKKSAATDIC